MRIGVRVEPHDAAAAAVAAEARDDWSHTRAHALASEGCGGTVEVGPPCPKHSEKSARRFVLNDGVPESRHQDASMVVRGLFRFIIFTGPYPAARFG